jgi:hypothetical protein
MPVAAVVAIKTKVLLFQEGAQAAAVMAQQAHWLQLRALLIWVVAAVAAVLRGAQVVQA